ncbi:hypothetical protein Tco_1424320 [Tanacetum coccineum]
MRILSVVGIKAYSRYGYDYLKEITLRIADYKEYTIAEKDFKNSYPSDFEDLNLLLLQGHLNHLSGLDKRMLSTVVNLDGMLTNILEALHYRVKEYKVNRFNPVPTEMELELEQTQQGSSLEVSVQVKMEMEIPHSSGVYFITACSYSTDTSNDLMKAQVYVSKLSQL